MDYALSAKETGELVPITGAATEESSWKFEKTSKNGYYITNLKHGCRIIYDGIFDCWFGPKDDD